MGAAMKSFACGDVVPGCDARWVCDSEDEILVAVAEHAGSAHALTAISTGLVSAVRAAIQSV
jgi:predicted small metal-binding protein